MSTFNQFSMDLYSEIQEKAALAKLTVVDAFICIIGAGVLFTAFVLG
ncbi:MAG TPA: hypothetical protein VGL94_06815 [Ktedonobacteraceae bacterium]